MLNPRRITPLLVALFLVPALAEDKPKKAKPFPYSDKSGKYTITIPGGWTTEAAHLTYTDTVLQVRINGAVQRQSADMNVLSMARMGPPASRPKLDADGLRENIPNASHHETGLSPLPHLSWHYSKDESEYVRVFVYLRIRGLGFRIILDLTREFLEKERAKIFEICASLKADIPPHPAYPKDYKVEQKGLFVFLTHPRVKQKTNDLKKIVQKQAKAFGKFHTLPKETDAPAQILIHPDREDARSIMKEVADSNEPVYLDLSEGRMFAVPIITDPTKIPGAVAQFTQYLLLMQAYGSIGPKWVGRGESIVARIEMETGKKLPNILPRWERGFLANPIKPLPEVRKMTDQDTMQKHAGVYIGFFKRGDKKYRKAYKAFIEEWRTTGDFEASEDKHILSLDQAKLHKAATNWRRRKLKHVKAKKK